MILMLGRGRPDWDLTAPEVKAAWQPGERERFFPYCRTLSQVSREQG